MIRRVFLAIIAGLFGLRFGDYERIRRGEPKEYVPEEATIFLPWHCDGCSGCTAFWHAKWFAFGFYWEDGVRYVTVHSTDEDGDWDCVDSWRSDDPHAQQWEDSYSYEESLEIQKRYVEWVRENKQDPLEDYWPYEWPEIREQIEEALA